MKNKIIVTLCLVLVFAAGALSVMAYQDYRAYVVAQHKKAVAAQQEQADESLQRNIRFNLELDRLKAQCAADHQTYVTLTPVQRSAKGAVKDCDPALLQLVQ